MTEEELDIQIREEKDEEAKKAYSDKLQKCEDEPEDYLWFVPWKIILQENDKAIGNAAFKGPENKGFVEIEFSILSSLQKNGYMTEALRALVNWAFQQKDIYAITAETAPGNKACQKVLEKNGFTMFANGQVGPRYKIEKKRFFKTPVLAGVLLLVGIAAGILIDRLAIHIAIAVFVGIGVLLGVVSDVAAESRRKRITG